MRRLAVGLALLAAGCLAPVDQPLTEVEGAVGEPSNGFPSALERLGLMAINRARSDPSTVRSPTSTIYPARPPVIWTLALNQSARFHATTLELGDVTLMHSSPCTLNTNVATSGCSGDPSCACATPIPASCAMCAQVDAVNTCGTAFATRVGYFTSGTGINVTGEVAAAGYSDPIATVNGWMDEVAPNDGHRTNLTDQGITSNTMGYGHTTGTKECYSPFDISDSGNLKGATIPKIPTAAVTPTSGNAGTFTFYATWNDPSLGTPSAINVVVDGSCTPLALELGTDKLNATYNTTATLAAGCHTYYVTATDGSGATVTYPTTGAFNIPVGTGSPCTGDYVATAPAATCSGGTGSGGATSTGGTNGSGGATGTGGTTVTGTGGATGSGGSSSGGSTGTGGVNATGGTTGTGGTTATGGSGGATDKVDGVGGCSCDAGANGFPPATVALPILALLMALRRPTAPRRIRRR